MTSPPPPRPAISLYTSTHIDDAFEDDFEGEPFDFIEEKSEPEAKPQVWSSYFVDELKYQAKKFIKTFFFGKQWYCGGLIDPDVITSEHYVELVLNTELETGIQMVYDHWHTAVGSVSRKKNSGEVPADVEAMLEVQRQCNALGIPKAFRGGITMMYFEFCQGFDYSNTAEVAVGAA